MSTPSVSLHPYFKVHAGQMEAAKALLPKFVEKTRSEEGVLFYDFTVNGDVVHCREAYRDAAATLFHLQNVGDLLGELLKVSDLVRVEFHGPAEEIAKLRGPTSHLNPDLFVRALGI